MGAVGLGCNLFGLVLFHGKFPHIMGTFFIDALYLDHGHVHQDKPALTHSHSEAPNTAAVNEISIRRSDSIHSIYGLPAQNRVALKQVAQEYYQQSRPGNSNDLDVQERGEGSLALEDYPTSPTSIRPHSEHRSQHEPHSHHSPTADGTLNVRAVLLHVAGDALGSLGVVISGLIIWFLESPGRFYADPALSVAITILIMCSAIPLGMY